MARFHPQGGSSRRYFDVVAGEYCSYRQMLKRSGICPELRARERFAAGLTQPHKLRSDVGIPRRQYPQSSHRFQASSRGEMHSYKAHGFDVAVSHEPGTFEFVCVIAQAVPVVVTQVLHANGRRRFHCSHCPMEMRNEEQIAFHVVERHYQPLQVSSVDVIRYRPSNERRARMPWRAPANPDAGKIL